MHSKGENEKGPSQPPRGRGRGKGVRTPPTPTLTPTPLQKRIFLLKSEKKKIVQSAHSMYPSYWRNISIKAFGKSSQVEIVWYLNYRTNSFVRYSNEKNMCVRQISSKHCSIFFSTQFMQKLQIPINSKYRVHPRFNNHICTKFILVSINQVIRSVAIAITHNLNRT
eukprot:TRINITY_DN7420_c0_g1_i1.p2 TRINITY_DN7420_c0_g1~~TRINITY_DN7420_c0_g1_i1.p2  ORF type:complete len:167 (+),score=19.54 TRINITY_DN7420_c0_g1_i1:528-1028(+)